jgi:cytochrome d ubiquinol oxidase subunit I
VIQGLDTVPPDERPNPIVIHLSFDGMVASALFMLFIAIWFWLLYLRRRRVIPENRWLLRGIVLSGVLGFVAIELGWIVTEEGRQPWVIYGFLRTANAVTIAPFLTASFLLFVLIYLVLSVTLIVLLIRQARQPLPEMEWSEVTTGPQNRRGDLQPHMDINV